MKKLLVLRVWKESLPGFTKPRSYTVNGDEKAFNADQNI